MFYLVTGRPDAGKTYYVVRHLYKNYMKEFSPEGEFNHNVLDGFLVITDIEGLAETVGGVRSLSTVLKYFAEGRPELIAKHYRQDEVEYYSTPEDYLQWLSTSLFFQMEIQEDVIKHGVDKASGDWIQDKRERNGEDDEDLKNGWKVIYLLDEFQVTFPSSQANDLQGRKNRVLLGKTAKLFQRHRRLGLTFYVTTQDILTIWDRIVKVSQLEINALASNLRPPGAFFYRFRTPGSSYVNKTEIVKKDKAVYNLYKSAIVDKSEPVKGSKLYVIMISILILFLLVVSYFIYKGSAFVDQAGSGTLLTAKDGSVVKDSPVVRDSVVRDSSVSVAEREKMRKAEIAKTRETDESRKRRETREKDKLVYDKDSDGQRLCLYGLSYVFKDGLNKSLSVVDPESGYMIPLKLYSREYRLTYSGTGMPVIYSYIPCSVVEAFTEVETEIFRTGGKMLNEK